jgi:2-C-methyl-D-erythritol 4-phosphate cytidylyltransferase
VVLVLPAEDAAQPPRFLSDVSDFSDISYLSIVPGGVHRRDSVRAGLAALRRECEIVLVHDGARPFVDRRVIDEVVRLARQGEGAIAAVPVSDTLKEAAVTQPNRIERTVGRERLWRAQTPQGFPRAILERAHQTSPGDTDATDDASMVEALGVPVRLVRDSIRNLKITTRDDLALAELLARESP